MTRTQGSVLLASPFKSTRGYAWDFIGRLYARIADHLASHGISTFVGYPSIPAPPPALEGSAARAVELDTGLDAPESVRATMAFIRREDIRVTHFISHSPWSWTYLRMRRAGVRRIITYDHESGEYTRPTGLKRAAKWVLARLPMINADRVLAVSEYVARRQINVGVQPPSRVTTVWNGIPIVQTEGAGQRVRALFNLDAHRPLIICNCRATPEKGVQHLLRAFDRLMTQKRVAEFSPLLLYLGDGPALSELTSLRDSLSSRADIVMAGFRPDGREVMEGADLCVIPSVWQDAFPLAVLEAMARGKPVVATRVGGIPEMVEDGVCGVLVPPGDEAALADAILQLLTDPTKAAQFGEAARRKVTETFTPERQFALVTAAIEEAFGEPCEEIRKGIIGKTEGQI